MQAPRLASNLPSQVQAVLFILGLFTIAVVTNEYVLRFRSSPGIFDGWATDARAQADGGLFAQNWLIYYTYAVAVSLAAITGPVALWAIARGWAGKAIVVPLFIIFSCVGAVFGLAIAVGSGPQMLGGLDMLFYFVGLCFIWLACILMVVIARHRGDEDMMFEWLLHSTALAQLPAVIYPLTFLLALLGLTLEESYVGAVVLGFTGVMLVTFALVQALRSQPARAASSQSGIVGQSSLLMRQSWFMVSVIVTLLGVAYVVVRALGIVS